MSQVDVSIPPFAAESATVSRDEAAPIDRRVLLHGVSWQTYEALLADLNGSGMRLTYDRGDLEIMSPSADHESAKHLLCLLVAALADELDVRVRGFGSATFRRELRERGLEADECYYVANEPAVRGKRNLDLAVDPPPDVAMEIEVSRSAVARLPLYATLKVPEIWRYDGEALRVFRLQADGTYAETDRSECFPQIAIKELARFLAQRDEADETTIVRAFRKWVRTARDG